MDDLLNACSFIGILSVVHDASMEIAVADMAEDTGKQTQIGQLFGGYFYSSISKKKKKKRKENSYGACENTNYFRQPGDRNRHIRRPYFGSFIS